MVRGYAVESDVVYGSAKKKKVTRRQILHVLLCTLSVCLSCIPQWIILIFHPWHRKSKHEMYGTLLYTVTLKGRNMIFNTWQNYFCNSARVSGALICFVDCVSEDLPIAFRNDYGTTHSQRHYNFSHSLLQVSNCSTRRNIEQVMQQSSMAIDACAG